MNFFNKIFGSKKTGISISHEEINWMVDDYKWLLKVYGLPGTSQFLFTKNFFPKTFESDDFSVANLILDLAKLFGLNPNIIHFSIEKDLRDAYVIPLETYGNVIETEILTKNGEYEIIILANLIQHQDRLLNTLVLDFVKIKFKENLLEYGEEDNNEFLFIIAIYLGFGIILSNHLIDIGNSSDGMWQTSWRYAAEMPLNSVAFALALFAHITEVEKPKWTENLSKEINTLFNESWEYLQQHPIDFFDDKSLKADSLILKAEQKYNENKFDEAISILELIFDLNQDFDEAAVYNNLGYYEIRRNNIDKAIFYFRKALEYDETYAYANDNLGYVLVLNNELVEGKKYIDIAMSLEDNDMGYSYRNLALYYEAIGDNILAEKHYQLAFENIQNPVDLLDFHYGKFLLKNGDKNKGIKFLEISKAKQELEAMLFLNTLK